jgi:hypothetical protein
MPQYLRSQGVTLVYIKHAPPRKVFPIIGDLYLMTPNQYICIYRPPINIHFKRIVDHMPKGIMAYSFSFLPHKKQLDGGFGELPTIFGFGLSIQKNIEFILLQYLNNFGRTQLAAFKATVTCMLLEVSY